MTALRRAALIKLFFSMRYSITYGPKYTKMDSKSKQPPQALCKNQTQ